MYAELAKPFESIESAHEFVALLEESIQEAVEDVRGHLRDAEGASDERQVRALNLALYKLTQLAGQMHKSRRALNDLRSIRRLLFTERTEARQRGRWLRVWRPAPLRHCVKIFRMAYPAKLSRATIIQAALKMVEEDAAEPPSLRAIARRLHVATNALYNYFPDRSELNAAIAVAGSRKMLSSLKRAWGARRDARRWTVFQRRSCVMRGRIRGFTISGMRIIRRGKKRRSYFMNGRRL